MLEGYYTVKQVLINSVVNCWIPTYWRHGVVVVAVLLGLLLAS